MKTEATLDVECTGDYQKSKKPHFDSVFGNWLPGEHDRIVNFKVYLSRPSHLGEEGTEQRVDITNYLTEKEYSELYDLYLEECRNEQG